MIHDIVEAFSSSLSKVSRKVRYDMATAQKFVYGFSVSDQPKKLYIANID